MPASLSVISGSSLKRIRLSLILLLSPLFFYAQQTTLSGLWTGVMTNDSSSVRKDQSFEIALTEYRGKVYGYSRSEFIVNDTLYYIVKRVKGTIEGDICEVTDDEIIACNFLKKRDKGVKVTSTFYRNKQDSIWYLAGKWATNETKKYYTVTGKVSLQEEKDLTASKLIPHLEELNKANDIAFYKEYKEKKTAPVIVKTVEPENKRFESLIKTEEQTIKSAEIIPASPDANAVSVKTVAVASPTITQSKPKETEKKDVIAEPVKTTPVVTKTETPVTQQQQIKTPPQTINKDVAVQNKPEVKNTVTTPPPVTTKPVTQTVTQPVVETQKPEFTQTPEKNMANAIAAATESQKAVADPNNTVAEMTHRKSEFSQVVNFASDSLELSLYDNGEVDGDTVSVFLDGQIILAQQCLKVSAIKKTIHIAPGQEEFSLVLFADNLGKYPPNTGLLVVHDGEDVYNIRFSADYQKNAGVVFKRKKK